MKFDLTAYNLTNEEVAVIQINRSISLWLDEEDFISSLTLAGAAEEILGKCLDKIGVINALQEDIINTQIIEERIYGRKTHKKEITHLDNYFKNRLKHYNEDSPINFSAAWYSAEMIDRAITNYNKLTEQLTEEMQRFKREARDFNV